MDVVAHDVVDVDGPLHVRRFGGRLDGVPIVGVHGLDGSAANFVDVGPLLTDLGPVSAPDLPGFGRTPVAGRSRSMSAFADTTAEVLRREAPEGAVLLGNSMGGPVALLTAARHPELVRAVVLLAPALPRAGRGPIAWSFVPSWLAVTFTGPATPLARMAKDPGRRVRALLDLCYATDNRESAAAFVEMVEVAEQRSRSDAVRGWTGAARSLWTWLVRRRAFHRMADRVRCPVLVIDGADDPIIPTSSIDAAFERHPDWQRVSLPGVGHVPQLEAPEATADAIRTFLANLP